MEKGQYQSGGEQTSEEKNFIEAGRPVEVFRLWLADAENKELNDHTAMSLATVDEDGLPNIRMVLLKDVSDAGFTFYTNLESAKGKELLANPKAALCFHWKALRRQVRIRGLVEQVTREEADEYFASRPRQSRIGAWASQQSRELESRFALEKAVARYAAKYGLGEVPRPDYWSGFRIRPVEIEFWRDRPFRLHERIVFTRATPDDAGWTQRVLYP